MARVEYEKVTKKFGDNLVIPPFDLEIADQEFLVFVGPSGCGKSTLLRLLAGLEELTEGEIRIDGKSVNQLPPKERDIAMVFQNYALYPHMTVFNNMAFGLKMRKFKKNDIGQLVREAARILEIEDLLARKPAQLSGGQRQRVAMGRAIVRKPKVFLFDEPLSNLDAKLRVQMRLEIRQLHQRIETTVIYVTHDQVEAMTLADRIAVINQGKLQQAASPSEVYNQPANRFVAGFIGSPTMSFIPGKLYDQNDTRWVDAGQFRVPLPSQIAEPDGREVIVGLRPEHLSLTPAEPTQKNTKIDAVVELIEPLGSSTVVYARAGKHLLGFITESKQIISLGQPVTLSADLKQVLFFDGKTEQNLMLAQ